MVPDYIEEFRKFYEDNWIDDLDTWTPQPASPVSLPSLTQEQQNMVTLALQGKNVLVDACVGSGKTTSIQALCNSYPFSTKILYLTYSKLLKLDARAKIKKRGVTVTNYHGFASMICRQHNIYVGVGELIEQVVKRHLPMPKYDVLVIDEYQDLEREMALMLLMIKEANPGIQIIAVGDMAQRVRTNTKLDILLFMEELLEEHEEIEFTQCFRLCKNQAAKLSDIWRKNIRGVNNTCHVSAVSETDIVNFLGRQDPKDVLCLGQRSGMLSKVLNELEERFPDKYNKRTVYASIRDRDGQGTEPKADSGIFTTYDSCKGLERKICVIFDYVPSYWQIRIRQSDAVVEILRNIFMVASSRGKELIIYVYKDDKSSEQFLSDDEIKNTTAAGKPYDVFNISDMYDFKYREDVEECYDLLDVKKIHSAENIIDIPMNDALIDLSPCVGIFQEASYFNDYDIDADFTLFQEAHPDMHVTHDPTADLPHKILQLISLETMQDRYIKQVETPFVSDDQKALIHERLAKYLTRDEIVQQPCRITITSLSQKTVHDKDLGRDITVPEHQFDIVGYCDVQKDDTIYELKFVSEIQHTHMLQCACYMLAFNLPTGVVFNVHDGAMYEIRIKDRKAFLKKTVETITKGRLREFTSTCAYELKIVEKRRKKQEEKQVRINNAYSA